MRQIALLAGPNFSGRSENLKQSLLDERRQGPVVFLGPSAASALTGLSATVAGELAFYESWKAQRPPAVWCTHFAPRLDQRLTSLSGGEQVLVALVGTGRADLRAVGVDCALEHLDDAWRSWALLYLASACESGVAYVVDNRLLAAGEPYDSVIWAAPQPEAFPIQLVGANDHWRPVIEGVSLVVQDMSFSYLRSVDVFRNCSFELLPGVVYRLRGPNGAGKSTLVRLLCGVLPLRRGEMLLNGRPYCPYREGNRVLAVAMQNPDDQWTDITVAGDLQRRLRHVLVTGTLPSASRLLAEWEIKLGLSGQLQQHVLDLPRALRKRLSWIWPLSCCLPWLVLDEPTIGQDDRAVTELAAMLRDCADRGHGVIYVSHDRRLADALAATDLVVGEGQVTQCR